MSQSNSSVFTTPTAKPEGMNDKYPIFSNICQNLLNHWQPKLSAFIREVNGGLCPFHQHPWENRILPITGKTKFVQTCLIVAAPLSENINKKLSLKWNYSPFLLLSNVSPLLTGALDFRPKLLPFLESLKCRRTFNATKPGKKKKNKMQSLRCLA